MMEQLQPLVGRWSTTITMIHPPEAKGRIYHAVDTYRWLPGDRVLVHEVQAHMGEDFVNSIEVYLPDDDRIVSRSFDSGGTSTDYQAEMADGVWRIVGATERFVSRSISNDAIEGLWQLKDEDAWVEWMTVRLDRVA